MASKIQNFIALLGLPRSGTTLATALIDAHSSVEMFYEPWHSAKNNPPPIYETPLQFKQKMRERLGIAPNPNARVVGFKETSDDREALEWSKLTLDSISGRCECKILWLVRDPMHAYLSKVDGAKKYWGNLDAKPTEEGYQTFIRNAIYAYKFIKTISSIYPTLAFNYDALVADPESILKDLMSFLDLELEPHQLSYHEDLKNKNKIMGDPRVAAQPQKVSQEFQQRRQDEAKVFKESLISDFWSTSEVSSLHTFFEYVKFKKTTSSFNHIEL